jgi:hypothetical protein
VSHPDIEQSEILIVSSFVKNNAGSITSTISFLKDELKRHPSWKGGVARMRLRRRCRGMSAGVVELKNPSN